MRENSKCEMKQIFLLLPPIHFLQNLKGRDCSTDVEHPYISSWGASSQWGAQTLCLLKTEALPARTFHTEETQELWKPEI